jgi:UDP-GlcNAc:undecaprenyl-phosphate GlcNAc-1-phosphate transferase
MKLLKTGFTKILKQVKDYSKDRLLFMAVVNIVLVFLQYLYIGLRFQYLNSQIPFWLTRPWGDYQLGPKSYIYAVPLLALAILFFAIILGFFLNKYFIRYFFEVLTIFVTSCNLLLFYSVVRIIKSASVPFESLVNPDYLALSLPFAVALFGVHFMLPYFIEFAKERNLITLPQLHEHPGMVLQQPSARSGGVLFAVVFLVLSFVFLGFSRTFFGLFLSLVLVSVLGLVDDIQNTDITSSFRLLENPVVRLVLMFLAVSPVVFSGIRITIVGVPLGGMYNLANYSVNIAGFSVPLLSAIITFVWIVWVMNVLSWSNGIDGQYAGIVGVASIVVAFLALRFEEIEPIHRQVATMAAISAGAAFGFTKYTWHPSKIMWGFSAVAAGLVISALSILTSTKVIVSVLIILLPFLDAVVTVGRRIVQGKNPLKGDMGHLHHLLMERGWSVPRIALFYWLTTALFGVVGLLTSERYIFKVGMTLAGLVAFLIILLNVRAIKNRRGLQRSALSNPTEEE